MPEFIVTDPNGKEHVVTAPKGATQAEALDYAKQQFGQSSAPATQSSYAIDAKVGGEQTGSTDPGIISQIANHPVTQLVGDTAKKSALPMAGQLAGAGIGTALGGPAGTLIGESIGGGVGAIANQLSGITEPSISEVVVNMMAGPVTRGVMAGIKSGAGTVFKNLAGKTNVAEVAQEVAKKMFAPKQTSDELFDIASKVNGYFPPVKTADKVQELLRTANSSNTMPTAINESIKDALDPLAGYFSASSSGVATKNAQALATGAQDLRTAATAAYAAKNHRLGNVLSEVRGNIFDDAAAHGMPEFKAAANVYRREKGVEALEGVLRSANPMKSFEDLMVSKKDRLFKGAFNAGEQKQIKDLIGKMLNVVPSGASGVIGRTILGGLGEKAAGVAGMITGGFAPDIAALALKTNAGRNYMTKLLEGGAWNSGKAAALAQFVASQTAEDAKTGDTADAIKTFMQSKNVSLDDKIKASMIGQQGAQQGGAADFMPPTQ